MTVNLRLYLNWSSSVSLFITTKLNKPIIMSGKIIQEESECCEKREAVLIMDGVFEPSKNEDKCELECPICYNYCAPPR